MALIEIKCILIDVPETFLLLWDQCYNRDGNGSLKALQFIVMICI